VMEEIRVYFNPENWSLMRLDPATGELFFVIIHGIDARAVENIRLSPGEGVAGIVVKTGKSIYVPDTSVDPHFTDKVDRITGFMTKSIMAVPIAFQDKVYGVMELVNRTTGGIFTEVELLILQAIADFTAIAFANAAMYEKALRFSITDPLTGLHNRAKLDSVIAETERQPEKNRRKSDEALHAVVFLIDIDNFKLINDGRSHREGDNVLRETARLLSYATRRNDLLFRIGGDEFLIIIFEEIVENVSLIKKRMTDELRKISAFRTPAGTPAKFSFGIASGPASQLNELIHHADESMYLSKGKRRNGPLL
jgi:diguanylate cyclase (GGDEF)-like protein